MPYRSPEQLDKINLHFIIGSNRSGTTLLTSILNAHPQVVSTPESRLTMTFYRDYHQKTPISPQFAADLAHFTKASLLKRGNNQKGMEDLIGRLDETVFLHFDELQLATLNYAQLSKLLLLNIQLPNKDYNQVQTIVDKNPSYLFYVKELLETFPKAKFIVALRDYRAIVLSNRQSVNNETVRRSEKKLLTNALIYAYKWNEYNQTLPQLLKKYPDRIKVVRYETLVGQPEEVVKEVCNFLNIPFLETMLSPQQRIQQPAAADDSDTKNTSEREQKRRGDLQKPINSSRAEAWRTQLTAEEIAIAELLCAKTGAALGYQPTQNFKVTDKLKVYAKNARRIVGTSLQQLLLVKYYFYIPYRLRTRMMRIFKLKR